MTLGCSVLARDSTPCLLGISPVLGFSVSSGGLFQACDLAMQWGIGLWAYGSLLVVGPLNHQSTYGLRGVDYINMYLYFFSCSMEDLE